MDTPFLKLFNDNDLISFWVSLEVSSDCIQRKRPDTIINFLKGLAGYAAFFTSGMITVASRYDSNDNGLPVFM